MPISATIPVDMIDAANTVLESAGFGPDNFSVPLRTGDAGATHAGLHCWDSPFLLQVLEAMQGAGFEGLEITVGVEVEGETVNDNLSPNFSHHASLNALEWEGVENWFDNPIMTGDRRTFDGKLWESLVDFNVWEPPIGWREVVESGYPAWVQPTGALDAYGIGDRVTHDNPNDGGAIWVYESTIVGNTTEPGRDGTFDRWWTPIEPV